MSEPEHRDFIEWRLKVFEDNPELSYERVRIDGYRCGSHLRWCKITDLYTGRVWNWHSPPLTSAEGEE